MASLNNVGGSALDSNMRALNDRSSDRLHSPQGRPGVARAGGQPASSGVPGSTTTRGVVGDSVQFSREALAANQPPAIEELSSDRAELVKSVRTMIEDDRYLSDEKLDIALDRLIDDALGIVR